MEENRIVTYDVIYEKMFTVMDSYCPMSDAFREMIYNNSAYHNFSKGELLVMENRDCNMLFFIVKGFCSCFYNKDGREYIQRFIRENQFSTVWHSFLGKQKSLFNIKATEDTTVIFIKRENFDYMWSEFPELVSIFCKILESSLVEIEERTFYMRSNQAEGRVRYYKETHEINYLMKHVPRYSIASYLDMTQETFSKIFTRLNKERE